MATGFCGETGFKYTTYRNLASAINIGVENPSPIFSVKHKTFVQAKFPF